MESNGSSGIGSLSSLRRRWLRGASTSLARSDSDDTFGVQYWPENGSDNKEGHNKRHKTRLGLTMLVQLAEGHERLELNWRLSMNVSTLQFHFILNYFPSFTLQKNRNSFVGAHGSVGRNVRSLAIFLYRLE